MSVERLKELRVEIRENRELYAKGIPRLSDHEYDRLETELRELEEQFGNQMEEESPLVKVGHQPLSGSVIAHMAPMYSLDSVKKVESINQWICQTSNFSDVYHKDNFFIDLKFDGMAVNLTYQKGHLVTGATRGDGKQGDNLTNNVMEIPTIPHTLEGVSSGVLEIRGELILMRKDFSKLNRELISKGQKPYASPRNAAVGVISRLRPNPHHLAMLWFIPHGIGHNSTPLNFSTFSQYTDWLRKMGFSLFGYHKTAGAFGQIADTIEHIEGIRDDLECDCDGVVVSLNHFSHRYNAGHTATYPRWAVAYKFNDTVGETHIEGVDFFVNRTGVISAVARLNPVVIGGITVRSASLPINKIRPTTRDKLPTHYGDKVGITRVGDTGPQITRIDKANPGIVNGRSVKKKVPVMLPDECPCCSTPLVWKGDELFCTNGLFCKDQLVNSIIHMFSNQALNIKGFGEKIVNQLVESGVVVTITDVFRLTEKDLSDLNGSGVNLARRLARALHEGRHTTLPRFLVALGIPDVGVVRAEKLAKKFVTLEALMVAKPTQLAEVDDIGGETARSIHKWFADNDNRRMVGILRAELHDGGCGISWVELDVNKGDPKPYKDLVFSATGKLSAYTREEVKSIVTALGGEFSPGITRNVDILIAGEATGEKLSLAQEMGIPVWTEEMFAGDIKKYR